MLLTYLLTKKVDAQNPDNWRNLIWTGIQYVQRKIEKSMMTTMNSVQFNRIIHTPTIGQNDVHFIGWCTGTCVNDVQLSYLLIYK